MSNKIPNNITEHPLYKAVKRCINHLHNENYDYMSFYPTWNMSELGRRIYLQMIKEIFNISEDNVEEFCKLDGPHRKSVVLYDQLLPLDTEFCKDLAYFVFSLPILEYILQSNQRYNNRSSWTDNRFSKNLREFEYEDGLMTEIKDSQVLGYFKEVINSLRNFDITNGLQKVAFSKRPHIFRNNLIEQTYKYAFFSFVVEPLCQFIEAISGVNVVPSISVRSSNYGEASNHVVELDMYIGIENGSKQLENVTEICCTIEVKTFPMLPINVGPPLEGSGFFRFGKIPNYMRQSVVQMTFFLTNYGTLTDAYTTTILLIDLDKFEQKKEDLYRRKGNRLIPLQYKIVNNLSHCPSARMTLFYHFSKSVVSFHELKERQSRMLEFRKYLEKFPNDSLPSSPAWPRKRRRSPPTPSSDLFESSSSRNTSSRTSPPSSSGGGQTLSTVDEMNEPTEVLIWEEPSSIIQTGIYNSQIFKIDAIKFKDFLSIKLERDKKVAVKVYDPLMCREVNLLQQSREDLLYVRANYAKTFKIERTFLQVLHEDKAFNSCYIPHKIGLISIVVDELIVAAGYFNLLQYIECEPLPLNKETYSKAKRQLEIIHNHGIIHGDIAKRNILFSTDKKVYIIDFQNSFREDNDNVDDSYFSKEADMRNLDAIFLIS